MEDKIIFKVVEAWGAMTYVDPDTSKPLYEETEDMCQCYWLVRYDTDLKEIVEWVELFPTKEQAEEYKRKLDEE